jgi:2-succinyl-5-enolpyruvyl-6-hydroxy-3-cyclohexene-1-carboxylate synthase
LSTDKPIVHQLAQLVAAKGIRYAVISSGSRNAPLVIAFHSQKKIKCLSVIDERSAAFFALGLAQQSKSPVALVCTSGSAVLNYAPAIAEAYYQKVPLLIFTADRPLEWIDQDDGQTIRQSSIFSNFIKASFTIPAEFSHPDYSWFAQRIASEAVNIACEKWNCGPVHINVPLREPLYGESGKMTDTIKEVRIETILKKLNPESESELIREWKNAKKKMLICGLHKPCSKVNELLSLIAANSSTVVITETTSNMNDSKFICNVDGYIESLTDIDRKNLAPDLLVTFGGAVTTKKFKAYLRKYKPKHHWHLSTNSAHTDTYQSLTRVITADEEELFSLLAKHKSQYKSDYSSRINKIAKGALAKLNEYGKQIPFSDFKTFQLIWEYLPENSNMQLGNSSPIRYANLLDSLPGSGINYFSNRGVSGIDGCMSTAAGAAFASNKITTLIVGDLSFMYDLNALWNKSLPANLRIIVINNGGGGIFRIIDSKEAPLLEEYFEAAHGTKLEPFVKAFGIPYYSAYDEESLRQGLSELYQPGNTKPVVLEVFTPRLKNAQVLFGYFKFLKKQL